MSETLEQRIKTAREANLALYLDDPSPSSAQLLVVFEETAQFLRAKHAAAVTTDVLDSDRLKAAPTATAIDGFDSTPQVYHSSEREM